MCKSCGIAINDGQKFCPKCGAEQNVNQSLFCSKCGAELAEGQSFCPKCGQKSADDTSSKAKFSLKTVFNKENIKKYKLTAIIAGVVIVTAIVLIIGLVPTKGKVTGVWKGDYMDDHMIYNYTIILNDDMSYSVRILIDGDCDDIYKGYWKISGCKILLEDPYSKHSFADIEEYSYLFGNLKDISGHYFEKL